MSQGSGGILQFGPFRVDVQRRLVERDSVPVVLTGKAFDILLVLLRRRGELVEKETLMREVWPDTAVEENNLTVNVSQLRKALGETVANPHYLITVPGRGYRLVGDAAEPSAADLHAAAAGPPARPRADALWILAAGLLICALAAIVWRVRARPASSHVHTIAVLPFRVLNSDSANEHLGLGLTAALITRLSGQREFAVRPLSSAVKVAVKDPLEAGRILGVETVIEGNVETDGAAVRLNVSMLRVQDGTSIWADRFDQSESDLFTAEDAISRNVAAKILQNLPVGRLSAIRASTRNGEAYGNYLRGLYHASRYTEEGFRKGLEYMQAAIDADPGYALAYSGLADTYYDASNLMFPPEEAMPRSKAAALRAVSLDPGLAEAHISLGLVASKYDWDWPEADRQFGEALRLDPNSAAAHQWFGLYRAQLGDTGRAIAELRRAQELDPLSSDSSSYLSTVLFWARQYNDALAQARRTIEFDRTFVPAYVGMGWVLDAAGHFPEAVQACEQATSFEANSWTSLALARARALAGDRGAARRMLDAVRQQPRFVSGYDVAAVYAALGQNDDAFAALNEAYRQRAEWLGYLKVDPQLDSLRADPRFAALLRRMRLD